MDDKHVDTLSRWLGQPPTRRGLLAGLAAGLALLRGDPIVAAQGDQKLEKQGRRAKSRQAKACRPRCRGGAVCRRGKCQCRKQGKTCTSNRGCCGNLVCRNKRCQRQPTPSACDVCPRGCRFTTVSAAVAAANAGATITVCPGSYAEAPGATGILLDKNLTIQGLDGAGAPDAILTAPAGQRLFAIASGVSVTMRRLRLQGAGTSPRYGVTNDGDLRMEACVVRSFGTGVGTGVNSRGNLTMTNCTIAGNTTPSQWGGLFIAGPARLDQCEVRDNTTGGSGGGIYVNRTGDVTLTDTTVSGNTATGANGGGGIYAAGGVVRLLSGAVVSGNTPDNCAGAAPAEGTCGP